LAAGGICLLVAKRLIFDHPPQGCFQEIVPGRAVLSSLKSADGLKSFDSFFIHNFGFSAATTSLLIGKIQVVRRKCAEHPDAHAMGMMGDFNLAPKGSMKLSLSDASSLSRSFTSQDDLPRPFEKRWNSLFAELMEVDFPMPSHINSHSLLLTRINRTFLSFPRSSFPLIRIDAGVKMDVTWYESRGLSDHCPIFVKCKQAPPRPPCQLRIKPEWCNHEQYSIRLQALCDCINWHELTIDEQSCWMKELQRDAALFIRDKIFAEDPTDPQCTMMRLSSISRCVWSRDHKLFYILQNHSDLARSHLFLKDGAPALVDPLVFEEAVRSAKASDFEAQRKRINSEANRVKDSGNLIQAGRRKNKMQTVNRLASMWLPTCPRIIIHGSRLSEEEAVQLGFSTEHVLRDSAGALLFSGREHQKALISTWEKVFGHLHSPPPEEHVNFFLAMYDCAKWDWRKCVNFSEHLAQMYVQSLRHTGTGKDGIHNFCFRFGCRSSTEFIVRLFDAFANNMPLPTDINEGLFVFLAKGDKADDLTLSHEGIYRGPTDLRPLTLKNADNKIVAGITNWIIKPVVEEAACKVQNGFTRGRQFLNNVVDLDAAARKDVHNFNGDVSDGLFQTVANDAVATTGPPGYKSTVANDAVATPGYKSDRERFCSQGVGYTSHPYFNDTLQLAHRDLLNHMPLLLLFDYAAAFPSVSHAWIRLVLQFIRFPSGLFSVVCGLYHKNQAFLGTPDGIVFMFLVLSGVLQGCPLSGSLFVIVIDPLLHMFKVHLEDTGLGVPRACADDVGVALRHLKDICILCVFFSRYELISGLTLKPPKCVIVLTARTCSDHNCQVIKEWLSANCPVWRDMTVCAAAKYLGFYLGPSSAPLQWTKALAKFRDKVNQIHSYQLPAELAASQFRIKAVPILGYIAQLVPPPGKITSIGLNAVTKTLRLAGQSLSYDAAHNLTFLGGPKFPDLKMYLKSCLMRSSVVTLTGFQALHRDLMDTAIARLPFAQHRYKVCIPDGWDSPAFCSTLCQALAQIPSVTLNSHQGSRVKSLSVQANIYKSLCTNIDTGASAWVELLNKRAKLFEPNHQGFSTEDVQNLAKALGHLPSGSRLMVTKTWVNSWATSRRMHESVLHPCFFCGMELGDDLIHYLQCDDFWCLIISSAKLTSPSLLSLPPLDRAGLVNTTRDNCILVVGAFLVYHSIKLQYLDVALCALRDRDPLPLVELTLRLAEVHFGVLPRIGS